MTDDNPALARLERYEGRTSGLMLVLAIAFLFLYAEPILAPDLPPPAVAIIDVATIAVWVTFAADLAARAHLSGSPWSYLWRHPIDLLLVVLPMLRPLRILRVFTAANVFVQRGGRFAVGRTLTAALVAAGLLMFIASVAILDAERGAPGTSITTFGDALWWSGVTVTTVGYGDVYPVTSTGRVVAFGLMLVGISVLGLITASVAAWFVSRTRDTEDELLTEVRALRAEVAELRRMGTPSGTESSGPLLASRRVGED